MTPDQFFMALTFIGAVILAFAGIFALRWRHFVAGAVSIAFAYLLAIIFAYYFLMGCVPS